MTLIDGHAHLDQLDDLECGLADARRAAPLILHCRFSHERVFAMVAEAGVKKAVFHWYSGPLELMPAIMGAGYYVSATPALQYSAAHRAAMREAPLERILVETDCPVSYRGVASHLVDVGTTARELAALKSLAFGEIARTTTRNAETLFNLAIPVNAGISGSLI